MGAEIGVKAYKAIEIGIRVLFLVGASSASSFLPAR